MNKFYMNGKLIHKASDHNTKRCEVEKWVFLPHSDFERLKANPYQEHEAITAARDLMYEDKNAYHCIMLLDEYGDDGLLIEADGFDYPRCKGTNAETAIRLINEASRVLQHIAVDNRDCLDIIRLHDSPTTIFYCDPPYYMAEKCYSGVPLFGDMMHKALHDALLKCKAR